MGKISLDFARNKANYECIVRPASHGDGWVCEFPDIPGCVAIGSTRMVAFTLGEDALEAWLEKASELGMPIPKPGSGAGELSPVKVRVPKALHERLARTARRVQLSLNELTIRLLTVSLSKSLNPSLQQAYGVECIANVGRAKPDKEERFEKDFSGTWMQRLPRSIHMQIKQIAEKEGISVNTFILSEISLELGRLEQFMQSQAERLISSSKEVA